MSENDGKGNLVSIPIVLAWLIRLATTSLEEVVLVVVVLLVTLIVSSPSLFIAFGLAVSTSFLCFEKSRRATQSNPFCIGDGLTRDHNPSA